MQTVSKGIVVDGAVLTVPVSDAVRKAIESWTYDHADDLHRRLESFGLNAYDLALPDWHRVVTAGDIGADND